MSCMHSVQAQVSVPVVLKQGGLFISLAQAVWPLEFVCLLQLPLR